MLQFHFFRRIDLLVKTIAPSGKRPDNMPNRPLFSIFIYLSTFSGGNQVPKETNVPECNPIQKKPICPRKMVKMFPESQNPNAARHSDFGMGLASGDKK